jgi:hypothetical protein
MDFSLTAFKVTVDKHLYYMSAIMKQQLMTRLLFHDISALRVGHRALHSILEEEESGERGVHVSVDERCFMT